MENNMADKELTAKQKIFCNEYLHNANDRFNATQSAIKAGYSKETASVIGYENLNKPYIRIFLDKEIDLMLGGKKELTKQWVDEIKRYAFMSPQMMGIEQVRASDKKGYMDLLGKYLTLFTEKKEVEHSTIDKDGQKVGIDYNKLSTEALQEIVKAAES